MMITKIRIFTKTLFRDFLFLIGFILGFILIHDLILITIPNSFFSWLQPIIFTLSRWILSFLGWIFQFHVFFYDKTISTGERVPFIELQSINGIVTSKGGLALGCLGHAFLLTFLIILVLFICVMAYQRKLELNFRLFATIGLGGILILIVHIMIFTLRYIFILTLISIFSNLGTTESGMKFLFSFYDPRISPLPPNTSYYMFLAHDVIMPLPIILIYLILIIFFFKKGFWVLYNLETLRASRKEKVNLGDKI